MSTKQLYMILNQLKKDLEIPEDENIRIIIKPMKTKAASISLKNKIIRLNKNLISLDPECTRYLLLHELVHFKLKSTNHNNEFLKQLYSKIDTIKAKKIEEKILTKMLELNNIYNQV